MKSVELVALCEEEVEECDDCAFEFSALLGSDCDWGETLPEDVLANVSGYEQRDTWAKTVTLLQELIQQDHNDTSSEELQDDENSVESAKVSKITIHAWEQVSEGLSKSNDKTEEFLCGLEQVSVLLRWLVYFNDLCTCKKLHDHTWGDNGGDTQLHEGSLVWSQDDSQPVERISTFLSSDTVEWDLAADQINEQSDGSPN